MLEVLGSIPGAGDDTFVESLNDYLGARGAVRYIGATTRIVAIRTALWSYVPEGRQRAWQQLRTHPLPKIGPLRSGVLQIRSQDLTGYVPLGNVVCVGVIHRENFSV